MTSQPLPPETPSTETPQPAKRNTLAIVLGLGCGLPVALVVLLFVGAIIFFSGQPEGGVLLANSVEQYALDYIEDNSLLNPGEKLVAYYDVTVTLDGSEAAILSDQRIIYHKDGRTSTINLADIERVDHSEETLVGDIIDITTTSGESMLIEIAPFNGGELFLKKLEAQRAIASNEAAS